MNCTKNPITKKKMKKIAIVHEIVLVAVNIPNRLLATKFLFSKYKIFIYLHFFSLLKVINFRNSK